MEEGLQGCGPVGVSSFYSGAGNLPDAEISEAYDGGNREDYGKEYSLSAAYSEEYQGRDEIDEGGQNLHGV